MLRARRMRIRRLLKGTGVCKAAEFENKVYNDELTLLSMVFYRVFGSMLL